MNKSRIIRLGLALAIFAAAGWAMRGYITDDTYIHLRYAENLLRFGEFSFNPGQQTYGASSPLWIFGLALLLKLGFSAFAATKILGGLSGLLVLILLDKFLELFTFRDIWKTLLLVLLVADAWFLRWSWSGMETPLATAMLLMLLWPLFSGRDVGWGVTRGPMWHQYLAWGVLAGLAGLVRPEFMLIAPLALPLLLWFEYFRAGSMGGRSTRYRARPFKPTIAAGAGWLLVIGPWWSYAWSTFGRLLPESAVAKSSSGDASLGIVLGYLWQSVRMLAATQGMIWVGLLVLVAVVWYRNSTRDQFGDWRKRDDEDDERESAHGAGPWSVWGPVTLVGIAVVWTIALLGGYALSRVWIISRYVCVLSPVLMLAIALIAEWLLRGTAINEQTLAAGRRTIFFFALLALVANGWLFTSKVLPHARQFPVGVRECYLELGHWLRDNTPADTVIAAMDIGALGYGSERQVLDLMGLVSPEVLTVGRKMGFADMVTSGAWLKLGAGGGHPDYFVDRSEGAPRWIDRTVHGVRFDLVQNCPLSGVGLRENQSWTVVLYRLVSTETRVKSSAGG